VNFREKAIRNFVITTFVSLYVITSIVSTIHVIDFFKLSNPAWLAVSLAIAFEIGAAASLASLITLDKMNKGIVWSLFIILTLMQAMGNAYYAYIHLRDFQGWIELFGLVEEELIYQKRVLSIVSGAILPIVALGFIKSLVDYIKPEEPSIAQEAEDPAEETILGQETDSQPIDEAPQIINKAPRIDKHISIDARLARGLQP
jgi:hypothetical protein